MGIVPAKTLSQSLKRMSSDTWRLVTSAQSGTTHRLLPLVSSPSTDHVLCLDADGGWAVDTKKGAYIVGESDSLLPLLIFVTIPLERFKRQLEEALKDVGVHQQPMSSFPFSELILCALDMGTEQWVSMGLSWLHEEQSLATTEIRLRLAKLSVSKALSQRTRQAAKRYARLKQ